MPPLRIEFMPNRLDKPAADTLKKALRIDAAERFSVSSRELMPGDITVIFDELHPWSEPSHDIVVRMVLDSDPERLSKDVDDEAQAMADLAASVLEEVTMPGETTIGVALDYGHIGWATAVTHAKSAVVASP